MKNFALPILFSFISSQVYAASFKNITETCSDFEIHKASVSAICKAENGAKYKTALRLRGINNHNGVLTIEADSKTISDFHVTCLQLAIDSNGILGGKCKNSRNAYVWATVDLKNVLRNYNGTLVYPLATE